MGLDYLVGTPFSGLKRYLGKMIVKNVCINIYLTLMLGLPQLIWRKKTNIASIMTSIIVYATQRIWRVGETIALHYWVRTKNVIVFVSTSLKYIFLTQSNQS